MSNLEKFIYNAKKKRKKNFMVCITMFIVFAAFCYCVTSDWFMPVGVLIMGLILSLYFFYYLYKLNNIKNKLSNEEKIIFDKELLSLNFDGMDYALTDNYIFDYNKIKLIPFDAITAIKKEKNINLGKNAIDIISKVKIWTNNGTYTYICNKNSTSLSLDTFTLYYSDLYNYIMQKNPNIEER